MYIRLEFDKYKDVVEMEERDFLGTKFIITTIPRILNDSQFVCPRIRTLSDESLFDFMERDEVLFAVNGGHLQHRHWKSRMRAGSKSKSCNRPKRNLYPHETRRWRGQKRRAVHSRSDRNRKPQHLSAERKRRRYRR